MTTAKGFGLNYENWVVVVLALCGAVAAIDMVAFNFLSTFIVRDLHLTNGQVGIIGGSGMAVLSLGALVSGLASDRLGRRRIFLVVAMLSLAVMSSATAFVGSFAALLAARMLLGLSEGPIIPMKAAIMHAESTPGRRGVNLGLVQNFGNNLVAGVAGPIALVTLATHYGWRNAFLIVGVPAVIMALVVQFTIRDVTVARDGEPRLPLLASIGTVLAKRNIRLCFLIGACAIGWLGTMVVFVPLWLVRQLHFSVHTMGLMMACLGAAGALASFLVPGISDRIGRRKALVIFALIGVVVPIGMVFGPRDVVVLGAAIFVGSLFTGIFPLFISIIPMESVDPKHGATALAVVLACAQLAGSVLGPVLGGALADRFTLAAPMYGSIVFAITAAIIGSFLIETAPKRLKQDTTMSPLAAVE